MIDNEQLEEETVYAIGPKTETEPEEPAKIRILSRQDLLKITGSCVMHLTKKSINGRLVDIDLEKLRDAKSRLLCEFIKTHGALLKDETLEQIENRLQALEERVQ